LDREPDEHDAPFVRMVNDSASRGAFV